MATLVPTAIKKAGIADIDVPLVSADVAGDKVPSASGLMIVMKNADSGPHTLTVAVPSANQDVGNLGLLDIDPIVLTVAAADTGFVSIPQGYADANGDLAWTYDAVTSLDIGVFSIAP